MDRDIAIENLKTIVNKVKGKFPINEIEALEFALKELDRTYKNLADKNIEKFNDVAKEILDLHISKNNEYDYSYEDIYEEFDDMSLLIPFVHEVNRLKMMVKRKSRNSNFDQNDIKNLLMNVVNYVFIWLLELNKVQNV